MLVEYSVKNFRSIREKQTLRMPKFEPPESDSNEFTPCNFKDMRINRSVAIYGANASGKTNLMEAIRVVQFMVASSARTIQFGESLPVTPFKFDQNYKNSPSEFEFLFIAENELYHFGLSATTERVFEEWLNVYVNKEPVTLYSRTYNKRENSYKWYINDMIGNERETWKNTTKQNSLFISVAILLNCKYLLPVFNWFSHLKISSFSGWDPLYTAELCNDGNKEFIKSFLNAAHLDISEIRYTPEDQRIEFGHEKTTSGIEFLNYDEESRGTQKLFTMAGPIVDILRNGHVLIIDEFENCVHPMVQEFLISNFHNEETNNMNAQLIFSTHNVALLDLDLFNNEQIWLCERDRNISTILTSIGEYESVEGVTNIEKAYLQGRFGGVPIVNPTEFRISAF